MQEKEYKKRREDIQKEIQKLAKEHEEIRIDRSKYINETFNLMLRRQEEMLRELFIREANINLYNQQIQQIDKEFKLENGLEEKNKNDKPK